MAVLLALPVLIEESLTMMVGMTDWWLTGIYLKGAHYHAAMALIAYMSWLIPSMFAAVGIGATAVVARRVGAGDHPSAAAATRQAILLGGVLAVVMTLIFWLLVEQFVGWMQLRGESARLAVKYLKILTPAIPAIMMQKVIAACLRGAGDTLSGSIAKCLVNLVNISVSYCLVTGWGPFPCWGWEGLAVGAVCGHFLGASLLLLLWLCGRAGLLLEPRQMRPDFPLMMRLLRVGLPGGGDVMAVLCCQMVFLRIVNSLGEIASAAHGLGIQLESIVYLPCGAFHVAAATMAGQYLGAKNPQRAFYGVLTACVCGVIIAITSGLVLWFGGPQLTAIFTGDPENAISLQAARLLKVVTIFSPSLAVMMVLSGGLRGAGDTLWPWLMNLVGFIGIRLPLACWLACEQIDLGFAVLEGWGVGVEGAWWAMASDLIIRSLLFGWRFGFGNWREARV